MSDTRQLAIVVEDVEESARVELAKKGTPRPPAQYCGPWLRTQENYSLSLSRETVKKCSEHIQRMLED